MNYKEIKEPFAVNGDREGIDYTPTSLEVSWLGGYSYLYGLKPDETNLNPYIEREKFNEIMFLMSSKMLDIEKYAQNINQDLDDTKQDLDDTKNTLGDDYVTRGTAQTISGLKTFNDALPRSAKNPTHQDELVRMGFLSQVGGGIGYSQTYKSSRLANNIKYYNTTQRPIGINIVKIDEDVNTTSIYVSTDKGASEVLVYRSYDPAGVDYCGSTFFIVPPGEYYKLVSNYKHNTPIAVLS